MRIDIENKAGIACMSIAGEMTIYEAADLKERLIAAIEGASSCELDLAGVTEIDTAGIQLLILAKRHAAAQGKPLAYRHHSTPVLELMDLYDLAATFGDPLVEAHDKGAMA